MHKTYSMIMTRIVELHQVHYKNLVNPSYAPLKINELIELEELYKKRETFPEYKYEIFKAKLPMFEKKESTPGKVLSFVK